MKGTKAAGRYAQSLLDLAIEHNALDETKDDMVLVASTCTENHDLELMLQSPIIRGDKKQQVLEAIFKPAIALLSMKFIHIVVAKGRESMLSDIASAFVELYKQHKGVVTAHVTTAIELTKEQKEIVGKTLSSMGNSIEIVEHIDPNIIGGLKVTVGDQRIDASFRKKLNELKYDILNK